MLPGTIHTTFFHLFRIHWVNPSNISRKSFSKCKMARRIFIQKCIKKHKFCLHDWAIQRAIYIENLYPETLPFIDYSKLGFQRLLYEITDLSLLKEYVKDTIGPLLDYDKKNNTDYYDTLLCYYRNFKNVALTAKKLNYHRNSMILRIQKIESILNIDFNSIADFYNIYVALEIEEYLIKIEQLVTENK